MNCLQCVCDYEPVGIAVVTFVKVSLTFVPRAVIVPMQTTIISANITAYSTAVGPSSLVKNFFSKFMMSLLSFDQGPRSLMFETCRRLTLTTRTYVTPPMRQIFWSENWRRDWIDATSPHNRFDLPKPTLHGIWC